mgnify:CR=1 FL=1
MRSELTFGTIVRGLQVYGYKVLDGIALAEAIVPRQWTAARYLDSDHIAPTPMHPGARGVIDDFLALQGLERRIAVRCSHFSLAPMMVAQTRLVLTTGQNLELDITMEIGAVSESVTVSGAAAVLETDSSDRGQVMATRQILDLPLNGRSYADLALLSPGVRKSVIVNYVTNEWKAREQLANPDSPLA